MIRFNCPKCSVPMSVAAEFAGRKGRCQACGAKMLIPQPVSATVADVAPVETSRIKRFANGVAGATRLAIKSIRNRRTSRAVAAPAVRVTQPELVELAQYELTAPARTHAWGIASLLLGFFSLLIIWLPYFGVGLSLAACMLGIIGLIRTLALKGNGITSAVAGTTISFCGIVLGGAWTMLVTAALSRANLVTADAASPIPVAALQSVRPRTDDEPADALVALARRHVAPAPVAARPAYSPPAYAPPTRVTETPAPNYSLPVKRAHPSSSGRYKESKAEKIYEKLKGVEVVHRKDGTTYERKARKK